MSNHHQHEVVIVGAGGAGLMAALYASRGADTAVISKLFRWFMNQSIWGFPSQEQKMGGLPNDLLGAI